MNKTTLWLLILIGSMAGITYAQSLTQEQQQGAQDKIAVDEAQIAQIQQDEASLNAQYQSAYNEKDSQVNALESEVYLLNSWLNPPVNANNPGTNTDTQGTVQQM